jgi:hypothetical protein
MPHDPLEFFNAGLATFIEREKDHLLGDVAERNLCARLMHHLESVKERFGLRDYRIDPELNRMNGVDVKYMLHCDGRRIRIECDLAVHRWAQPDNLIAIEMKKSGQPEDDKKDNRTRLDLLTLPRELAREAVFPVKEPGRLPYVSDYELGLFLVLDVKRQRFEIEEYRGGRQVGEVRIEPF